jgi:hypothetical protein
MDAVISRVYTSVICFKKILMGIQTLPLGYPDGNKVTGFTGLYTAYNLPDTWKLPFLN